jgi:ATP diphosphatase
MDLDPEQVLRAANRRFELRVRHVEHALAQAPTSEGDMDAEVLDQLWEEAKESLRVARGENPGGGRAKSGW